VGGAPVTIRGSGPFTPKSITREEIELGEPARIPDPKGRKSAKELTTWLP
jgi:hypothetical protein